ncbi:MAG: dethiobiotin synthase [Archangium sp.]
MSRSSSSQRLFVTGTDTGVGKSEVSSALLRLLAASGAKPFAWKPCETGGDEDSTRLWKAAGAWQRKEDVCSYRFKQPLAPGVAAKLEKRSVDFARLVKVFRDFGDGSGVVEGAGGLHVPLAGKLEIIDLIGALKLPVVLVARAGLGTLNHTTLSMNALLERKVRVAAIVLSRSSAIADPSIPHNAPELQRRFPRVRVLGPVPFIADEKRRERAFERALAPVLVRV